MTYQAVIFDLDGTLADTIGDIAGAVNHALNGIGQPQISLARCRDLVGHGIAALLGQAMGDDPQDDVDRAVGLFHEYYAQHLVEHTAPYAGVAAMLDDLVARGLELAVLSNKPHAATVRIVKQVFASWSFTNVAGQKPDVPLKPDPTSALAIANDMNIVPPHCVYVGDSGVDMLTAKAAGFFGVGVTWGFRDEPELRDAGADAIIHHPAQLLEQLAD